MGNTDGFAQHYICDTSLYLMSMLSQAFSVFVDRGITAPVHGREVVYGLNTIYIRFLFQLMSTVKITGEKGDDTHMVIHTGTRTSDVSLASEFQNSCLLRHSNMQ